MILFSQNFFKYLSLTVCLLSTWIILGAIPALQMGGRFPQVETQILGLHLLGGILFLIKSMETFFLRKSIKELNNNFFLVTLSIGLLSFLSSFFNKYFYSTILGSNQIGQGAIWYLDFAILILFFSTIVNDNRIRFIYFLNIFLLTIFVSIFTIFPFWKGTNISFFYCRRIRYSTN